VTDAPQEDGLQQNFEYATETDVPQKKKFATTRKAGYVEEEVDEWVKDTIQTSTEFLNRYNAAVYALNLAKTQVDETVKSEVEAAIAEALETQRAELVAEYDNHTAALDTSFSEQHANLIAELEVTRAQLAAVQEELLNASAVVYEPTPVEPVVEPPSASDTVSNVSRHAQEILTAAAQEAGEHVSRSLERVAAIEAEAEAEAAEVRENAYNEAAEVLSSAKAEAKAVRDQAVIDANNAIETKNKAIADRNAIFERLNLFHTSQQETISTELSSVGYTPFLSLDAASTPAIEASPEETVAEEIVPVDTHTYVEAELTHDDDTTAYSYEEDADDAEPVATEAEVEAPVESDSKEENYEFGVNTAHNSEE